MQAGVDEALPLSPAHRGRHAVMTYTANAMMSCIESEKQWWPLSFVNCSFPATSYTAFSSDFIQVQQEHCIVQQRKILNLHGEHVQQYNYI